MKEQTTAANTMQPYLSPLAVWALSVGSAIGWGSLVVTSRSYLTGRTNGLHPWSGDRIRHDADGIQSLSLSVEPVSGHGGLYQYVKQLFGFDFACLKTLTFSSLSGQRSSMRRRP